LFFRNVSKASNLLKNQQVKENWGVVYSSKYLYCLY